MSDNRLKVADALALALHEYKNAATRERAETLWQDVCNALEIYSTEMDELAWPEEKDLAAAFSRYWLECEGPSTHTTGNVGREIWFAACNWLARYTDAQLAVKDARIMELERLVAENDRREVDRLGNPFDSPQFELCGRALKAEARVAELQKALDDVREILKVHNKFTESGALTRQALLTIAKVCEPEKA